MPRCGNSMQPDRYKLRQPAAPLRVPWHTPRVLPSTVVIRARRKAIEYHPPNFFLPSAFKFRAAIFDEGKSCCFNFSFFLFFLFLFPIHSLRDSSLEKLVGCWLLVYLGKIGKVENNVLKCCIKVKGLPCMLWDNMSFISWKNELNLFLSVLQNIVRVMLNFLKWLFFSFLW